MRDYDGKFLAEFDALLASEGVEVKRVGPRSTNLNGYAERWVQTVRRECLDHFVVFGEGHLRHTEADFTDEYSWCRPQLGPGNRPLAGVPPPATCAPVEVVAFEECLGELLKRRVRRAA
jgi:putative transposase